MCAIFGIVGHEEAANLTYLGLHALQHRGQEGAGIVSTDGKTTFDHRRKGLVSEVFNAHHLSKLKGHSAIGHTRYSTSGGNTLANIQPMLMKSSLGWLTIAHNGNLVNAAEVSRNLEQDGSIFQSTSDTEVIIHLIARAKDKVLPRALVAALNQVKGAYSLLVMSKEYLIAVRDPNGFRPLVMGEIKGTPVFASETCAFNLIGADYVREVKPGEMVVVKLKDKSIESSFPFEKQTTNRCIFEYIYLARPDSLIYGDSVHEMRKALGRKLAEEQPADDADIVIPVPDSGVTAAIGYAEASKLPFDMGIIRSHYVGRTFIEPRQSIRDFGVKLKLTAVASVIKDKSVVIVDDSLVRGTTSKKLVKHMREAGAKKVHMRISAPPTSYPCFYGVDTPTRKELLASSHTTEQIRDFIGADSLGYLSLKGLKQTAISRAGDGYCHACFSGEYAIKPPADATSHC